MQDAPRLVVLDRLLPGEPADPAPDNILFGNPRARVANQYADAGGEFFCGLWQGTRGRWRVRYTEHEFCVILEGKVCLEASGGERHEFRAGDAFVVPAGFTGSWEVVEDCRKWYAIFEPRT